MNAFHRLFSRCGDALIQRACRRPPDFVIGGHENPYLLRWHLIPRNPVFNIYLHKFLRDDDDRALHDHPWFWCSILLRGGYFEHTVSAGGIKRERAREAPSLKISSPWRAHRIELFPWFHEIDDRLADITSENINDRLPAWSLFITGPRIRQWGFHCPEQGWVHWKRFTTASDPGAIGPGCDGAP